MNIINVFKDLTTITGNGSRRDNNHHLHVDMITDGLGRHRVSSFTHNGNVVTPFPAIMEDAVTMVNVVDGLDPSIINNLIDDLFINSIKIIYDVVNDNIRKGSIKPNSAIAYNLVGKVSVVSEDGHILIVMHRLCYDHNQKQCIVTITYDGKHRRFRYGRLYAVD